MSLENGEEKKPNNRQNAEVSWELVAKYCSKYAALTVSENQKYHWPYGFETLYANALQTQTFLRQISTLTIFLGQR